jgi:hypothetical protein
MAQADGRRNGRAYIAAASKESIRNKRIAIGRIHLACGEQNLTVGAQRIARLLF